MLDPKVIFLRDSIRKFCCDFSIILDHWQKVNFNIKALPFEIHEQVEMKKIENVDHKRPTLTRNIPQVNSFGRFVYRYSFEQTEVSK